MIKYFFKLKYEDTGFVNSRLNLGKIKVQNKKIIKIKQKKIEALRRNFTPPEKKILVSYNSINS